MSGQLIRKVLNGGWHIYFYCLSIYLLSVYDLLWTRFGSGRKSHLVTRIVDRRSVFYEVKFKVF